MEAFLKELAIALTIIIGIFVLFIILVIIYLRKRANKEPVIVAEKKIMYAIVPAKTLIFFIKQCCNLRHFLYSHTTTIDLLVILEGTYMRDDIKYSRVSFPRKDKNDNYMQGVFDESIEEWLIPTQVLIYVNNNGHAFIPGENIDIPNLVQEGNGNHNKIKLK